MPTVVHFSTLCRLLAQGITEGGGGAPGTYGGVSGRLWAARVCQETSVEFSLSASLTNSHTNTSKMKSSTKCYKSKKLFRYQLNKTCVRSKVKALVYYVIYAISIYMYTHALYVRVNYCI